MRLRIQLIGVLALGILALGLSLALADGPKEKNPPLCLDPENPHYFLFRGRPTILVGSGEHYGAVLNLDFDYIRYLDAIAADHLDHTRLFTGTYHEPAGAFGIVDNTLAPKPSRFILLLGSVPRFAATTTAAISLISPNSIPPTSIGSRTFLPRPASEISSSR